MTPDDAYEIHRENRPSRFKFDGVPSRLDLRIAALKAAIKRRRNRDMEWILQTASLPPIRTQRTRWFSRALERNEAYAVKIGANVDLTHVEKTLLYAMR